MPDLRALVEAAVMSRQGRKQGNEIVFRCPNEAAHKHSDAKPSANYNPVKQVWICRVCGEKGNYWHLARLLGLTGNGHRPNGWRETRRWNIGVATHVRLERDGEDKEVVWESNGKPGLDGTHTYDLPPYAIEYVTDTDADVLLSEGEKPTDALLALGFQAVGTVTGASTIPSTESLKPLAEHKGRVFLCRDNDEAGHNHMNRIAARLLRMGKRAYIVDWPDVPEKGDAYDYIRPGYGADDVQVVLDNARLYEGEAEPQELPTFNLTDSGNAEYFTHLYGDQLRYDHRRGRWLHWQKHHWKPEADGVVIRLALMSVRQRYKTAVAIEDLRERELVAKWAIQSEQRSRLEALVAIARNLKPIADDGEGWDSNPWLICVKNGVVDLRDGNIRDGEQLDRITQQANVVYNPDAKCPRWQQFQLEISSGNPELVSWKQKLFGYCISGITNEQIISIGYGRGANGKGREQAMLRYILGDYAYDAPFSTFELYNRANIPNDLAALVGRRLVTSSETNEGTRLNEARVKALSGEDPVTARFLHAEFFTFQPVAKLLLAVNHRPKVYDDSFGFWRRVRLIPYLERFEGSRADKHLLEKLLPEASGIFNWLLEGCRRWQSEGLDDVPDCITDATRQYEEESDPLSQFLLDECAINPQAQVSGKDFYLAYKRWCEDQGMKQREILTNTAFGRRMGQRFTRTHERVGAIYAGIGLKCDGFLASGDGLEGENNVFPNFISHVGENRENPSQPVISLENPSQSGVTGLEQPVTNPSHSLYTDSFLMAPEDVIALWNDHGRPGIILAKGNICTDLEKLLSHPDLHDWQLKAIRQWIDQVRG